MELTSPSTLYSPQASLFRDKCFASSTSSRLPCSEGSSRRIFSTFVLPSSAVSWLAAGPASAVSYDDLTISVPSAQAPSDIDVGAIADSIDVGAIANTVANFAAENPLAVVTGVAAVALPLVFANLFAQAKPWSSVSAKEALQKLETGDAQLLDIRSSDDIKAEGTPDLRAVKKRVYQIPYSPGDDEAFLKKLLAKFKEPSNTTLVILDQFDGNSLSVAKLATASGFQAACAIKGGAEGPNGWRNSELPWILPRKGFTLDISNLKDVIDSTFSENPNLVPATLGVAAAAGVSFVVFSEAETALQLLGSAALIQLFVKKFLFAKDREKTFQELQTFLDTKIAPKELVDELKGISGTLLPKYDEVASGGPTNGATASTESSSMIEVQAEVAATAEQAESKEEETKAVELSKETVPEEPKASAASTDLPRSSTPLSPYTQFPELKPPSSPTAYRS
ncbi:hypothetical protein GOP47_0014039 [Adiantum capillus-veneris]|uniref:Rhodanese domain-containing protein n=1 Tax=Adiantum capillus-veneris TaxID=13818 RepID=A0A9D4UPK1_ADICA|nr:hypothetical protein GOP47_0013324 [Adiantum capillus-veneris]KAI5071788.1 hypothetical protein GOP47_0014039 [Adiantum capillus-veneris]